MLGTALDASEEQKTDILGARSRFKEIWELLQQNLSLVSDLRTSIAAKNTALEKEIAVLQGILSPKQVAQVNYHNSICVIYPSQVIVCSIFNTASLEFNTGWLRVCVETHNLCTHPHPHTPTHTPTHTRSQPVLNSRHVASSGSVVITLLIKL